MWGVQDSESDFPAVATAFVHDWLIHAQSFCEGRECHGEYYGNELLRRPTDIGDASVLSRDQLAPRLTTRRKRMATPQVMHRAGN